MIAFFKSIAIFSSERNPFHLFIFILIDGSFKKILNSPIFITRLSSLDVMPPFIKKLINCVESSSNNTISPSIFSLSMSMGICFIPENALVEGSSFSLSDGLIIAFDTDNSFKLIFPINKGNILILAFIEGNTIDVPLLLFKRTSLEESLVNKWPEKTLLFSDHPLLLS